jgi:uncharacterized protein (DUF1697 family)
VICGDLSAEPSASICGSFMAIVLCRYVAFLRAVNGGQVNLILKEDLRSLFTESGANQAESYINSGNVVFECQKTRLSAILQKAHDRLRRQHKINQPIIVRTLAEVVVLSQSGIPAISESDYIGVMATFLSGPPESVPKLPVNSRRGDISVFEVRNNVVLSHRFKVNGNAGDANTFVERLLKVPATSRSWRTVQGLATKFAE